MLSSVNRAAASRWHTWFTHFLDPSRIQERTVCGPEGQLVTPEQIASST
jgi:hypothetical protein